MASALPSGCVLAWRTQSVLGPSRWGRSGGADTEENPIFTGPTCLRDGDLIGISPDAHDDDRMQS